VAAGADSGAGAAIARRLGAQWYLTGDIVEVAGRTQLNGALYASGGSSRPLATASVTGDTSALFQLVDDLTGQLLAGLLGGRDTALTRLAAVTTSSLPALKAFLRGEQALRAGRDAQAGAAFREAALMDTAFALAQYRLSLTANWVTIPGVSPVEWARLAARHSRRLTPMVRDLLGAYQAYKEVRWADAERLYRALTAAYPDHVEAWLMLGETFFHYNWLHGAPAADAWEPLQQVRALDPGNVHALIHLARLAALEGRTRTLDSLVSEFVGRYGDAERSLELRVLRASVRGDQAERATLAREARGVDDLVAYSMLEAAFVYAQNADAALELAPRFDPSHIGSEGWPAVSAQGRRLLVSVGPATGRWDRSLVRWSALPVDAADWAFETRILMAAEPAIPLGRARVLALRDSLRSRRPYPLLKALTYSEPAEVTGALVQRYLDGLLSVRLRERQVAEQAAGELAAGGPFGALLAHALRAEIAHASGDDRRALAALDWFDLAPSRWTALPSHWGTRARFLRAEVLRALGRADEAADFYESVHSSIDAPYLALAHLRRAQLHARRGDTAQARFHYGRFRSLWQDCDPEFRPLVEQAQRELAALPAAAQ
jgi:tetratricopeptide (TPR) repeat protein